MKFTVPVEFFPWYVDVSSGLCGCVPDCDVLLHVASVPLPVHTRGPGPDHAGREGPGDQLQEKAPGGTGPVPQAH